MLLAAPAQAQINDARPFEADYEYIDGFQDSVLTMVSGALVADLNHVIGTFGFFDAQGLDINDLERVCWTDGGVQDCTNPDPDLGVSLRVVNGGSAGVRFPFASDATYTADHALGLFVDFENEEDLNSFGVSKTLAAPAINGAVTFETIRDIDTPGFGFPDLESVAGLAPLDDFTTVQVLQDGAVERQFTGKNTQFSFEGAPDIPVFSSDFVFLPFEDDSTARFVPASDSAAAAGLKLERIDELMADLEGSSSSGQGASGTGFGDQMEDFQTTLSEVLNGAVMRVPQTDTDIASDFAFINFEQLTVTADLEELDWGGKAALQIQEGQVDGAPGLVGFGYFVLPWWSFLLWGIALTVWIVRMSLKAPKKHEKWDRFKWIGWVAGALGFVLLFVLWDWEVRSVWGTSLFTTNATGAALGVVAAVQILPLLFVLFAVAAPLRMMLKNGVMLANQGTFMGLSTGVAYLLAYVMGATLLLAYIELVLVTVLENVGG